MSSNFRKFRVRASWVSIILASLSLLIIGCTAAVKSHGEPETAPTELFTPGEPEIWRLANGLTIMFREDVELPLIQGTLYVPGGVFYQDSKELGTVCTMFSQMRDGGTEKLSPTDLDRELEKLAAGVSSSCGSEYGTISFSSLSSDAEKVFLLFSEVLLHPRFTQERLDVAKGKILDGIKRRSEDPSTIAGIALTQLVYPDTVYGNIMDSSDAKKISRLELLRMHRRFIHPNGAVLAVSGNISREKLEGLVTRFLGEWKARSSDLPPLPPVKTVPPGGVYFLSFPFQQSTVYITQLGVPRFTPDYYAIQLFNDIFGEEGFGSRLFRRVRSELGLVYSVYAAVGSDVTVGKNIIALKTKAESTAQSIVESLKVLKEMQQNSVTEAELSAAKRGVENSFVFNFDSEAAIVVRAAIKQLQRYPAGFDQSYISEIRKVSVEEIKSVAQNRWDLSKLIIIVVGNESVYAQLEQMLKDLPTELRDFKIRRVEFDEKLRM